MDYSRYHSQQSNANFLSLKAPLECQIKDCHSLQAHLNGKGIHAEREFPNDRHSCKSQTGMKDTHR